MNKHDLFSCCRNGDLKHIRYLVEQKDVDLNVRDKWDGTPLYYACLCGHYEIVHFLLQNGASCDANTFDGERCLYGALTRKIKNLLRNFSVITSKILRRDNYSEFLRRALEISDFCDVHFVVEKEEIAAHKSILAARSKYFGRTLREKWRQMMLIDMNEFPVTTAAFKCILQYLYLGRLDLSLKDKDDLIILSRHFDFLNLVEEIGIAVSRKKIVETLSIEPRECTLRQDFHNLFLSTLPKEYCAEGNFHEPEFADLIVKVENKVFFCHKIFICGRCDYLRALIADHFSESYHCDGTKAQVVTMHDVSSRVFVCILQYIYTDTVELSPDDICDVLFTADMFILPGLKKICSSVMKENLTIDNVVHIIKLARLYNLPRLESQCTEYMAVYLEQIIDQPDFKSLVLNDANEIKERQETDTISVIDDIRYHIDSSTQICHPDKKLNLIQKLLASLELDA